MTPSRARRRIRAVAFDMDGLMFNSEDVYWQVGTELLRRRGCEFNEELNQAIMGRPPRACFEEIIRWHALGDTWEQLAAESEELFIALGHGSLSPMLGLLELLDWLEAAGIPKAICTSSTPRLLTAVLGQFRMQPRFLFTLCSEDITHGKPHPEIYLKAAERFGIDPPEMLVLEDSQTGCRAAGAAGAFVVAVPGDHSRRQDFGSAALVVDALADPRLYEVLSAHAAGRTG